MIVVVEGASAAGKTTWCETHGSGNVVVETGRVDPPVGLGDDDLAQFWNDVNCGRWTEAQRVEVDCGLAICDTDPLKLHYDYCLARIERGSWQRFEIGVGLAATAIASHRLGIADVTLFRIVDDDTLVRQRDLDTTRSRSNFDLHRQLRPALVDWYRGLALLDPGRVIWELPRALPTPIERDRYAADLFQQWMGGLPRHS